MIVRKILAAVSLSVILVAPIPLEPNRGFSMMSCPSSSKQVSACWWLSVTAVLGTGNPCSWKSASEWYLSTDCSMALGGFMIRSPWRWSFLSRFILNKICSKLLWAMGRVMSASMSFVRSVWFAESSGL